MKFLKALMLPAGLAVSCSVFAWGNEGHEVVATIAQHYLTPKTLAAVNTLLADDTSSLTAHTLAAAATWADAYRASSPDAYAETHAWHFADIEVPGGTLQVACFDFPPLPAGTPASAGPPNDCHVDKISESMLELGPASTAPEAERILALKFILHFVGDLHQPLHSADENDRGGNNKSVTAAGLGSGNLHAFWDSPFVASYGANYATVATKLLGTVTKAKFAAWYGGDPKSWVGEANAFAVSTAYGMLPAPSASGVYALPATYVSAAESLVGTQLTKAGVRLAYVLNQVFDPTGRVPGTPTLDVGRTAQHRSTPTAIFVANDLKYQRDSSDR